MSALIPFAVLKPEGPAIAGPFPFPGADGLFECSERFCLAELQGVLKRKEARMNTLGKGLAAVGLLLGATYAIELYNRNQAESFCGSVSASETRDNVVTRANSHGLFVSPLDTNESSVLVFNHRAPMWRYACDIEFKAGKVSSKKVFSAD
ncbi:hypothetical protein [Noviluteimonas gilva]|uniref:Uncharacterized protein n=1 Tax=Noviluteimonas gilva TaxID=2682097 RepID=A0A7C9HPE5_9GAMM|nr:hypothetical protein [Lysobacter gilvus]MUV15790.1 hypothetical protein [Lysobacter gilvus]